VTRWHIRRIVNDCAAQQLVARRDVLAPEFISYGLVSVQSTGVNVASLFREYPMKKIQGLPFPQTFPICTAAF
jgi:hypothetical protein